MSAGRRIPTMRITSSGPGRRSSRSPESLSLGGDSGVASGSEEHQLATTDDSSPRMMRARSGTLLPQVEGASHAARGDMRIGNRLSDRSRSENSSMRPRFVVATDFDRGGGGGGGSNRQRSARAGSSTSMGSARAVSSRSRATHASRAMDGGVDGLGLAQSKSLIIFGKDDAGGGGGGGGGEGGRGNRGGHKSSVHLPPMKRTSSLSSLQSNGGGGGGGGGGGINSPVKGNGVGGSGFFSSDMHEILDQEFNGSQQRNLYGARGDNGFELGGLVTSSGQGEQQQSMQSPGRHRRSAASSGRGLRRSVSDSGHLQDYNMAGTHLDSPSKQRRAESATSQMQSSPHASRRGLDYADMAGSVGFSPRGMSAARSQGSMDSPRQQRKMSAASNRFSEDMDDILSDHPGYSVAINNPGDGSHRGSGGDGGANGGGRGGAHQPVPIPAPRRASSWSEPQPGAGAADGVLGLDGTGSRQRRKRRTSSMARSEAEAAARAEEEMSEEDKEPWYMCFVNQLGINMFMEDTGATSAAEVMAMVRQGRPEKRDCPYCLVIRIGGGYIVLGYGRKCTNCGNHIDVSLGASPEVKQAKMKALESIAEEALADAGNELLEEVIREMAEEAASVVIEEEMSPIHKVVNAKMVGKEWKKKTAETKAAKIQAERAQDPPSIIAVIDAKKFGKEWKEKAAAATERREQEKEQQEGIQRILPDGTVVKSDGSRTLPDGSTIKANGTIEAADGTITQPDGTVVAPDGTITRPSTVAAEPGEVEAEAVSTSPTVDAAVADDDDDDDDDDNGGFTGGGLARKGNSNGGGDGGDGSEGAASDDDGDSFGFGAAGKERRKKKKKQKDVSVVDDGGPAEYVDDPFTDEEDSPKVVRKKVPLKKASKADMFRERQDMIKGPKSKGSSRKEIVIEVEVEEVTVKPALDFLAKHCILPPEKRVQYQNLFDQVDVDNSKKLDNFELTHALKALNANLINDQEIEYTMRILDLMTSAGVASTDEQGQKVITAEQFMCIAALSEKIAALDKATKDSLNDMNFDALEKKMMKAKDLFWLNDPEKSGEIDLDTISIILKAGRIADEHEEEVMMKFADAGMHTLSFLDFLAYVPLFVDIHDDINSNPTKSEKRGVMQNLMASKTMGRKWKKKAKNCDVCNSGFCSVHEES